MLYDEYVKRVFKENGWDETAGIFNSVQGKKVLIFTHDDPDGLSSGCILKQLVELKGGVPVVRLPETYELEESRLDRELSEDEYFMVILADKGTMGYYSSYADKVDEFLVIDHHPPIGGSPDKVRLINPNTEGYNLCSTSFLAHMLMTFLGEGERYDDFLALIGLKGDWAVEPATDFVSGYVSDFYSERVEGSPLCALTEKISSRPTMFEVSQREKTTLINRITEFYFALGGGGFQYFYNDRDDELSGVNQAELSFRVMDESRESFAPGNISTLEDYISASPEKEKSEKIYRYFLEDWERALKSFTSSTPLAEMGGAVIYLFIGHRVPLMPMAGSVYLSELSGKSDGKEVVFIMINRESGGGIHFSVRGTSDLIHSGRICAGLSSRLVEAYGYPEEITGGGHIKAGECKTRKSPVTLAQALRVFSGLVIDMESAALDGDRDKAEELGLEYLRE